MTATLFDLSTPEVKAFADLVADAVLKALSQKSETAMLNTQDVCRRYCVSVTTLRKWRNSGYFPPPDIGGDVKGANCLWRESTLVRFDRQCARG
ncbi:MAG: helix-turn-helix domain-containing protein [Pyramidobacter sp.]|nr:helix-turn-helix domain-containing protein [Pyramidobacter sp.]